MMRKGIIRNMSNHNVNTDHPNEFRLLANDKIMSYIYMCIIVQVIMLIIFVI